ncbi:hypothetical protein [Nocardia flavorosea]|uniref:Uncharacterized protein n=1 Tax=Nocardia flavorosea TaxID=53429 RepID=A0A846YHE4_9NOCA|nr:hypothetical protein [Nocardia flavorosea]NKY59046.1 hypothetical protein [Nocardia flavorosea]
MTMPASRLISIASASIPSAPTVSNKQGSQPTTPTPVAPPGPGPAAVRRRTTAPGGGTAVDDFAADVHWPDPSPLHQWWTEVMDGVNVPRPRRAA